MMLQVNLPLKLRGSSQHEAIPLLGKGAQATASRAEIEFGSNQDNESTLITDLSE